METQCPNPSSTSRPAIREAARAQLKSAMDGLNAAAAGQPAPTGLADKLGKDANRTDELCTIGGATD
jgi:hypothetical protein